MIRRPFWIDRIEAAWKRRPVVWLAGVRRSGKTTLARMLEDVLYLNCELPSTIRRLEDPELFFRGLPARARVVLDEVHRLPDPARPLKIAADEFPGFRVLATGSSTLAAGRKFRDTLAGRKVTIHLAPVLWPECEEEFGLKDLDRRLLRGGLPPFLLQDRLEPGDYLEWLDSFYARDIQELFGIRERTGFLDLLRLVMRQSGGLVDLSALSRECDLSRPTVKAHLEAMRAACALFSISPFHGGSRRELVRRPRVYAFDTGFVAFARAWDSIRGEDRGILWEHLVLDAIRSAVPGRETLFWRDKSDREVDFVVPASARRVDAIEAKVNPDKADPEHLAVFRQAYPVGRNFVVSPGVREAYDRRLGRLVARIVSLRGLMDELPR